MRRVRAVGQALADGQPAVGVGDDERRAAGRIDGGAHGLGVVVEVAEQGRLEALAREIDGNRADALGRQPLDHLLPGPGPVPGAVDEDHDRCSLHAPILAQMADTARISRDARAGAGRPGIRGARGVRGALARRRARRARPLPGPRPRRRGDLPGRARQRRRPHAATREGAAASGALRPAYEGIDIEALLDVEPGLAGCAALPAAALRASSLRARVPSSRARSAAS